MKSKYKKTVYDVKQLTLDENDDKQIWITMMMTNNNICDLNTKQQLILIPRFIFYYNSSLIYQWQILRIILRLYFQFDQ